jgi:VanZ family protein
MIRSIAQLAFVVGLMLLLVLCLTPGDQMPPLAGQYDKLEHGTAFLMLALCGRIAFPSRRALWFLLGGLAVLGAAIEFTQMVIPGRDAEFMDEVADVTGAILGLGLGEMLRRPLGRLRAYSAAR